MSLEVDPQSLRDADRQVADAVIEADNMLGRLESELASFGQPWGADDIGSLIGEIYTAAYAMAMNSFNSNLDTMDGYATRLSTAAESLERADQDSAERTRRPMDSLPDLPL